MTQKANFHSLIRTQLRLSNLFADCPLVEVKSLPLLSTTVGGEVEKPVRRNWLILLIKDVSFLIE